MLLNWEWLILKVKRRFLICFISIFFIVTAFQECLQCKAMQSTLKPIKDLATYQKDIGSSQKVIYLTFDDGPSNDITNKILDILKENEIKATFFLIGNQIDDCRDVMLRIRDEGHSIGLHTYTHKFKRIYSSREAFVKEMIKCKDKIEEVTGVSSNIIRFPGGSQKHLSNAFMERLHNCNFKIYDWNMETTDGLTPKASPDKLYREATKGSEELSTIILLLHCDYTHKNTCRALPRIIKYYKAKGYEFKAITEDTPELYFPIKKK